jgi:hypothetical protein
MTTPVTAIVAWTPMMRLGHPAMPQASDEDRKACQQGHRNQHRRDSSEWTDAHGLTVRRSAQREQQQDEADDTKGPV